MFFGSKNMHSYFMKTQAKVNNKQNKKKTGTESKQNFWAEVLDTILVSPHHFLYAFDLLFIPKKIWSFSERVNPFSFQFSTALLLFDCFGGGWGMKATSMTRHESG